MMYVAMARVTHGFWCLLSWNGDSQAMRLFPKYISEKPHIDLHCYAQCVCFPTLISFKRLPNIRELLQMSSKTSPKTCSLLNCCESHVHIFWSSWGKENELISSGLHSPLRTVPQLEESEAQLPLPRCLVFSEQAYKTKVTCSPSSHWEPGHDFVFLSLPHLSLIFVPKNPSAASTVSP